jgi:homoserine dehydrogenase
MTAVDIAILGLGTVGSGLVKLIQNYNDLNKKPEINIKYIFVRDKKRAQQKSKEFGLSLEKFTWNIDQIANDEAILIVIETMGGVDHTEKILLKLINKKKNIVSANKDLIALRGENLFEAAKENQIAFLYEAAVAGGIPIINTLKQSLQGNKINKIFGIINGTTNYILDMMKTKGWSFEEALKQAQELGFAEADPTNDIGGHDAAFKTAILASIISGKRVDVEKVYREGIEKITTQDIVAADKKGYVIKLLGIINNGEQLDARVHPVFVPKAHPLAKVDLENNAVFIQGDAVQDLTLIGKGAGSMPTASSVMADLMTIASQLDQNQTVNPQLICKHTAYAKMKKFEDVENSFYMRLVLEDKVGVLKDLGGVMAKSKANVKFINQYENQNSVAHADVFTDPISEKSMKDMISKLEKLDSIRAIESVIRVIN